MYCRGSDASKWHQLKRWRLDSSLHAVSFLSEWRAIAVLYNSRLALIDFREGCIVKSVLYSTSVTNIPDNWRVHDMVSPCGTIVEVYNNCSNADEKFYSALHAVFCRSNVIFLERCVVPGLNINKAMTVAAHTGMRFAVCDRAGKDHRGPGAYVDRDAANVSHPSANNRGQLRCRVHLGPSMPTDTACAPASAALPASRDREARGGTRPYKGTHAHHAATSKTSRVAVTADAAFTCPDTMITHPVATPTRTVIAAHTMPNTYPGGSRGSRRSGCCIGKALPTPNTARTGSSKNRIPTATAAIVWN